MGRRMVRDVIRNERNRGTTVFLNSHLLSEIEVTCDRVAFLKEGEVVATQDLAHSAQANARRVSIRAANVNEDAAQGLTRWTSTLVRHGVGDTS